MAFEVTPSGSAATAAGAGEPFPSASWEVLRQLTDEYHAMVADREKVGDEAIEALRQGMQDRGAIFGGRSLSPYLRPNFLTRSQFRYVGSAIRDMMAAIRVVEERAMLDSSFLDRMGVTPGEAQLIAIEPGLTRFSYKSRMDTFLTPEAFKFVEYNAESPAGIGYGDVLQDLFYEFEPMRRLREKWPIAKSQSREEVLKTLLAAWEEWGGREKPRIGIVDYLDVPTYNEFVMFREYFESRGYEAVVADPRHLEFRKGRLMAGDFGIDLLYRRVLVNELLERLEQCQALVEAVRTRSVCMVNSFRAKLLHKKLLFAALWAPDMQPHFSAAQRDSIRRHVPWTVRVAEGRVERASGAVDLVEFARAEQQRLVLKPNDEYGGKGVVIGWEKTPAEWEQALAEGLQAPCVLQERVPVARTEFPDMERHLGPRVVDLDPFIFGDRVTGCLTRLSDTSLCNVTSGGGQVPTFIVED